MRRSFALPALVVLALVQIGVPVSMIVKRQDTLSTGRLFRFRTAPVDPYDAFRGRYVALAMERDTVADVDPADYPPGQKLYVLLEEDEEGFARPGGIERRRPETGAYVVARVPRWPRSEDAVHLAYPFDRYYMNERRAPEAERAYREHSSRATQDAWVEVRIKRGYAVLEELYVAGVPIGEFLDQRPASRPTRPAQPTSP